MKKGKMLLSLGCIVAIGLMVGYTAQAQARQAKPEFVWKFQTAWAAGLGVNKTAKYAANLIYLMSDGRLKLDFHYGGEICPEMETLDAVAKGVLDATHA
jgi:TRAP-type mannitol/chloroaromatic compound transport system substrate-binding protein